jgi:hypothetical protein
MTTFVETNNSSRSILKPLPSSQSVGREGQELNEKINKVNQSIQKTKSEYIRKLLQPWLEANKNKQASLQVYLESLKSEALENNESQFTVAVLEYSWQVWKSLSNYFSSKDSCLEVPDACPGDNNDFMYTWSKAEHYLECEIFGSGAIEFFYRNRKSGDVWGEDTTLGQDFSISILEKVALFSW